MARRLCTCDYCTHPLVVAMPDEYGYDGFMALLSHRSGPALIAQPAALNIDYEFNSLGILVDGWGGPRPIYANAVRLVDSDSRPETKKYEKRVVWCGPPPRAESTLTRGVSAWVDSCQITSDRLLELAEARQHEALKRKLRRNPGFQLLRLELDHRGVLKAYMRQQMMGVLVDVVGLTERQAQCFSMAEGLGMSNAEIERAVGISKTMVKRHLKHAAQRIQEFKGGREVEGLPPPAKVKVEREPFLLSAS